MSAPAVLPAVHPDTAITQRLAALAEERMLEPARRHGYELRLLGATVLPQRQVIVQSPHGRWLFVDEADDPTARSYRGQIPVPAAQRAKLLQLRDAGVRPELVWLGHELGDGWRDGDPVPIPTPAHLREKDARLVRRLRLATRIFAATAGATLAVAAPLALAGLVGAGLDPIVLGGVRDPEAPIVQWALLAQWEWL